MAIYLKKTVNQRTVHGHVQEVDVKLPVNPMLSGDEVMLLHFTAGLKRLESLRRQDLRLHNGCNGCGFVDFKRIIFHTYQHEIASGNFTA